MKLSWNVSRACHSYFIPEVLAPNLRPLKVSLMSRFHNFFMSLLESPSHEVQIMARLSARDLRSSVGSNLRQIAEISSVDPWAVSNTALKHLLNNSLRARVPAVDQWRINYLPKLLDAKLEAYYSSNTDEDAGIGDLILSLVTN